MAYRLRITSPDDSTFEILLRPGETVLGRSAECDVLLDGRGVSRKHAVMTLDGHHIGIRDLQSRYGTQVNGQPITACTLKAGDTVLVGSYRLEVAVSGIHRLTRPGPAPPPVEWDATEQPQGVYTVFPRHAGSLQAATVRLAKDLETAQPQLPTVPQLPDYRALILISRVNLALGRSYDLRECVELCCDLCAEELSTETAVILRGETGANLFPSAARYPGALTPSAITVNRALVAQTIAERSAVGMSSSDHIALAAPLTADDRTVGVLYVARSAEPFTVPAADLASTLGLLVGAALLQADLREQFHREQDERRALERFHPPDVASLVATTLRPGQSVLEEGHATALAIDISGYASLVERNSPHVLAAFLNDFYDLLCESVFSHRGTLVRAWDGRALAIFGIPRPAVGDGERACRAALTLRDAFLPLRQAHASKQPIDLRLALDTGAVLAGPIGPPVRLEYTALGEPIALASDLAARGPEGSVVITDRALQEVPSDRFRVRTVERAYGTREMSVYEIVAEQNSNEP